MRHGRPLWTLPAGTARLAVAAGLGWIAAAWGGVGSGPSAIVAASMLVSAAGCIGAALGGALWRGGRD